MDKNYFTANVDPKSAGERLDVYVGTLIQSISRSQISELIRTGNIRVHGNPKKPGYRIKKDDSITVAIPPPEPSRFSPEPLPIWILHEDDDLLVINKQPGLVVHPAPGHSSGTLVNALLHHRPWLKGIGGQQRPGIVHRLDKDTSGTLVIAKNDTAHLNLSLQFKERTVQKRYIALVSGEMKSSSGNIDFGIGRHPTDRKKMSVHSKRPRDARTIWRVQEAYKGATLLSLTIRTGRTHQIRVHLSAINRPILGDPVYGGGKNRNCQIAALQKLLTRQMLHSEYLEFTHPKTRDRMSFVSPMPDDMKACIDTLNMLKKERFSDLAVSKG